MQHATRAKPRRATKSDWTVSCLAAGILGASFVLPADRPLGNVDLCPLHAMTGIPCPGCGMTRSVVGLSHGHFEQALRYHPLGLIVYALLIVALFLPLLPGNARTRLWGCASNTRVTICAITLAGTVWGFRLWAGTAPP